MFIQAQRDRHFIRWRDYQSFVARNAKTGDRLWSFPTNQVWKASPMTCRFDGIQYIAIAAGGSELAFRLPNRN